MRLEDEADILGDSLRPPFAPEVRRIHFGRDRYRMAWIISEEDQTVDVLAVDLKENNFYSKLRDRWEALVDRFKSEEDLIP